jgi:hypothetical protein
MEESAFLHLHLKAMLTKPIKNLLNEKTTFTCHKGLFQFNVMPFGISTAPSLFQELAKIVLQDCEDFATAYSDDIIIFSKNEKEHVRHIQEVFDRLRQHGLKMKMKKCTFFQTCKCCFFFTLLV